MLRIRSVIEHVDYRLYLRLLFYFIKFVVFVDNLACFCGFILPVCHKSQSFMRFPFLTVIKFN